MKSKEDEAEFFDCAMNITKTGVLLQRVLCGEGSLCYMISLLPLGFSRASDGVFHCSIPRQAWGTSLRAAGTFEARAKRWNGRKNEVSVLMMMGWGELCCDCID